MTLRPVLREDPHFRGTAKVYPALSSLRLPTIEKCCHGLPAHRPPSAGDDPGTTPPRTDAAPSSPVQKRDNETHRAVNSIATARGDGSGTARAQGGSMRGRCKTCGEAAGPRNRASRGYGSERRAFSCMSGGRNGGRLLSCCLSNTLNSSVSEVGIADFVCFAFKSPTSLVFPRAFNRWC